MLVITVTRGRGLMPTGSGRGQGWTSAWAVAFTWSLDTLEIGGGASSRCWGGQVIGHSGSPEAASILSVLHDIGVSNKTV